VDFLEGPTDEDDLANQMNQMDRQLQEIILRDIGAQRATTQQRDSPQAPLQLAATANEDKEQFDQLIPEA
jgi:hypothetical protein